MFFKITITVLLPRLLFCENDIITSQPACPCNKYMSSIHYRTVFLNFSLDNLLQGSTHIGEKNINLSKISLIKQIVSPQNASIAEQLSCRTRRFQVGFYINFSRDFVYNFWLSTYVCVHSICDTHFPYCGAVLSVCVLISSIFA